MYATRELRDRVGCYAAVPLYTYYIYIFLVAACVFIYSVWGFEFYWKLYNPPMVYQTQTCDGGYAIRARRQRDAVIVYREYMVGFMLFALWRNVRASRLAVSAVCYMISAHGF